MEITRYALVGALLCPLILFSSCQLPNVQPFAEGVAAIHTGVSESGAVFRESAASVLPPKDPRLDALEDHWKKRHTATSALVEYADSLASIVDAGSSGKASAEELGNAVSALMAQVGPTGLAGSAALQIGGEIYEVVASGLAAGALDEAVKNAGPSVARTCEVIVVDLETIRDTIQTLEQDALAEAETDEFNDEVHHLANLRVQRTELLGKFVNAGKADPSLWASNHAAVTPQLEALDKLIAESQSVVDEGNSRIDGVRRSYAEKRVLLDQTAAAIRLVAREHAKLADAIKANRSISARNLLQSANQIATTIDRIEKIRETRSD